MIPAELKSEIASINKDNRAFKPHRYIALLTAIEILKKRNFSENRIYFSDEFRQVFSQIFSKYSSGNDRNRPYTPFFHLRKATFWRLVPKLGKGKELERAVTVGGPSDLLALVQYAELSDLFMNVLRDPESLVETEAMILRFLESRESQENGVTFMQTNAVNKICDAGPDFEFCSNRFVGYLNSLQRLSGGNENALAESQACNKNFPYIHVNHPVTKKIADALEDRKSHVILTGHAGDGKSTIAIAVFKQLCGLSVEAPLTKQLQSREDIPNKPISIIKDLSERDRNGDDQLLTEIIESKRAFLLVTNTGTLLDFFRDRSNLLGMNKIKIEIDVLSSISDQRGEAFLNLEKIGFSVFNLASMDNLLLPRQVFEKMLDKARWAECRTKECCSNCPIFFNVNLILENKNIILDRVFLAYRRMYEYGTRLSMRQITEHLAYLVTSGLGSLELTKCKSLNYDSHDTQHLFFNRFFGDDGTQSDQAALKIRAILEIRKQGYGEHLCPTWERKLWLRSDDKKFVLEAPGFSEIFGKLQKKGSNSGAILNSSLVSDQARDQCRRMLYFLHDFPDKDPYLPQYLQSPCILKWVSWQKPDYKLTSAHQYDLKQRIFHVLQEHMLGLRLPEEGSITDNRWLYITLNRKNGEVRQSAQVVLAEIDWETKVQLSLDRKPILNQENRRDLKLEVHINNETVGLELSLPLLDHMTLWHLGEISQILKTPYSDRLDVFKDQIRQLSDKSTDELLLLSLRPNNTFDRRWYSVANGKLEVR